MTDSDPDYSDVLVVNPLPWTRDLSGPVSKYAVAARGDPADHLSARHWQDRRINAGQFLLPPTEVPGFGYRVIPTDDLIPCREWPYTERRTVETDRHRLRFDRERGGVASWFDDDLGCQWVDRDAPWSLTRFVLERLTETEHERPRDLLFRAPPAGENNPNGLWNAAPELVEPALSGDGPATAWGYQTDWNATRIGPDSVERHRVYRTPLGPVVRQSLSVPHLPGPVELEIRVPDAAPGITVEAEWEMGRDTHPTSTYLAFPFDVPEPEARLDVGDQAVRAGRDQLPGTCRDYYTVQRWVDLSNADRGMTVGCPLNPMVQLGDFHFGDARREFSLERAALLGWVTTNFYNTNFRARQPGRVRARYHLRPHDGGFDEALAHRVGREADHARPLVQPLAEGAAVDRALPPSGSFLELPSPPVLVPHVGPVGAAHAVPRDGYRRLQSPADRDGDLQVTLLNASDESRSAQIGSGVLRIANAAVGGFPVGRNDRSSLDVEDGAVEVELEPRELLPVVVSCA